MKTKSVLQTTFRTPRAAFTTLCEHMAANKITAYRLQKEGDYNASYHSTLATDLSRPITWEYVHTLAGLLDLDMTVRFD